MGESRKGEGGGGRKKGEGGGKEGEGRREGGEGEDVRGDSERRGKRREGDDLMWGLCSRGCSWPPQMSVWFDTT